MSATQPQTKAGRALLDDQFLQSPGELAKAILAIEAEKDAEYEGVVDRYRQQRDDAYEAGAAAERERIRSAAMANAKINGEAYAALLNILAEPYRLDAAAGGEGGE